MSRQHGPLARCLRPQCRATVQGFRWARIQAAREGWFFPKDQVPDGWCPDHLPDWVPAWRARKTVTRSLRVLEICTGAGGQALGLEQAGFATAAVAEIDPDACNTLRANRPGWGVIEGDIRHLDGRAFEGIDLLAGGVPCSPFTISGQQLGQEDERDMFPVALRLIEQACPRAVMLENVPGLAQERFAGYRAQVTDRLTGLGFKHITWRLIQASEHGVPQLRPRFVLVALRSAEIAWPEPRQDPAPTVGEAIGDLMAEHGWPGAELWTAYANTIAPTIVGGSKKHGGPDLGPTRARQAWMRLRVDGRSLAARAPGPDDSPDEIPHLTVRMVARLQGFPDDWVFAGRKTAAYRQVGNAFCPPVARALGRQIAYALKEEG